MNNVEVLAVSEAELRQTLIATAIAAQREGLNRGASGNLSVRCGNGFLITPSGMAATEQIEDDVVWMDFTGNARGSRKPSSEWRFHRDLYVARPEFNAVLHAHSTFATTLACLGRDIPPFHYMIAAAGGKTIRCAPYATFGTQELSDHAITAMEGRKACLLGNHGLLLAESDPGTRTGAGGGSGKPVRAILPSLADRHAQAAFRCGNGCGAGKIQKLRAERPRVGAYPKHKKTCPGSRRVRRAVNAPLPICRADPERHPPPCPAHARSPVLRHSMGQAPHAR